MYIYIYMSLTLCLPQQALIMNERTANALVLKLIELIEEKHICFKTGNHSQKGCLRNTPKTSQQSRVILKYLSKHSRFDRFDDLTHAACS